MKEHYVSFECADKLKELGFSDEVTGKYVDCPNDPTLFHGMLYQSWNLENNEILAPRLDQAQAWLREVKGIDIEVITILNLAQKTKSYKANLCYFDKNESGEDCANYKIACLNIHSYEKALELGIDKALELLTNKS